MDELIKRLEQQALQTMMNPRFIFNVMNTIQYFINSGDRNSANNYLVDFAKLIRMNQMISDKKVITLTEEIAYLFLYLSFEKVRFEDNLTYDIIIDPEIKTCKTKINAMMIQPFIENALWHGILPMNSSGHINLLIEKKSDHLLKIRIEDNGVGISDIFLADNLLNDENETRGECVAIQRLKLLQKSSGHNLYIRYTHATPHKINKGTILEMLLPIKVE